MKLSGAVLEIYGPSRIFPPRRVEKPNGSNRLDSENRHGNLPAMMNPRAEAPRKSSRFETHAEPCNLRNGTSSAFVAQILGQILETDTPEKPAVARAYARQSRDPRNIRLIRIV